MIIFYNNRGKPVTASCDDNSDLLMRIKAAGFEVTTVIYDNSVVEKLEEQVKKDKKEKTEKQK